MNKAIISTNKLTIKAIPHVVKCRNIEIKSDLLKVGSLGVVVCLRGFCWLTPLLRLDASLIRLHWLHGTLPMKLSRLLHQIC